MAHEGASTTRHPLLRHITPSNVMSPPTIYVLGIGNLGKLLAHSIRKRHPEIPIKLLFHRNLEEQWDKAGRSIEIVRNGIVDRQNGFRFEQIGDFMEHQYPMGGSQHLRRIENLIVATKTRFTVQAIQPLKDRLGPTSTILFVQNGMGTIDEVTAQLFDRPESQPNYLAGIFNHGVYAKSLFSSVHIGLANAVIGRVFSASQESNSESSQAPFLAQAVVDCPELAASFVTPTELLYTQLQKLVVNAVINPLTSIFDCDNGQLFQSAAIRDLIDRMIAEISAVVLVIIESRGDGVSDDIRKRFSPPNLKEVVYKVGEQTAQNISSMRQDYQRGRLTEIDYINGYIVRQGKKHGVQCTVNATVVGLVEKRQYLSESDIEQWFKDKN